MQMAGANRVPVREGLCRRFHCGELGLGLRVGGLHCVEISSLGALELSSIPLL